MASSAFIVHRDRLYREAGIGWRWTGVTTTGSLDVIVPDQVIEKLVIERWLPSFLTDPAFHAHLESAVLHRLSQPSGCVFSPLVIELHDFKRAPTSGKK